MVLKVTIMPLDIDAEAKPITQTIEKEEITIGRLPSNDIVLNRPEVSGIHARLRVDSITSPNQPKLFITDLGSSNGTLVEKNPLRPRVEVAMLSNERIFVGNFVIKPVVEVADESFNRENVSISEGTSEMRKSYLNDALKEYQESVLSVDKSKEIEDKIEKFAEERAVANGLNLSSKANFDHEREGTESSTSISALYTSKQNQDDSDNNYESGSSLYPKVSFDSRASQVSSSEPNQNYAKKSNPIQEAFNSKRSYSKAEDVVDSLKIKVTVGDDDVTSFDFKAAAYSVLRGKVMHKGAPLSDVKVSGLGTDVYTNAEGNFEFPKELEGSSYELSFEKDKFIFEPSSVSGKLELDSSPLETSATKLFSISGIVSHHGRPLSGVTVDGGVLGKVITGDDGSYKFEDVPEGQEYDLTLTKEGFAFLK